MPLSISNSNVNERLPNNHWLKTWLITLFITLSVVISWEYYCRSIGFTPDGVADTPDLWVQARKRASLLDKDAVILLGASRGQLGINTTIMSRYTNTHPVQLALDGSQFMPVLQNLAEDETIKGTIILDLEIANVNPRIIDSFVNDIVDYYQHTLKHSPYGATQPIEDWLSNQVNKILGFRVTGANPQTLIMRQLEGKATAANYLTTLPDRSRQADYTKVPQPEFYLARVQRHLGEDTLATVKKAHWPEFEADLNHLESLVKRIKSRGGRIIFVRYPTDKAIWQIDEARFPRTEFWDRLVKSTSAETIHFKDYPDLAKFNLPDGSHLDYRDAIPFTDGLCKLIFKPELKTASQ